MNVLEKKRMFMFNESEFYAVGIWDMNVSIFEYVQQLILNA